MRLRLCASVLATALAGTAVAQVPADVERAKELYSAARTANDEGRYEDAVRDFGASYELTKDPALFYWIGNANEKAGKCDVALTYYGRYLREAQPSEELAATVRQRIVACGGSLEPTPPNEPADAGSPTDGANPAPPVPAVTPPPAPAPAAPIAPPPGAALRTRHQGPWLLIGGSLALVTVGAVLAYSANASENDISDLYVGLEGTPPAFDARTKQRYDDLVAEGERYERLSWLSFGLAAGLAAGAAVWFYVDRDDERAPVITPTVTPGGAGATATLRF